MSYKSKYTGAEIDNLLDQVASGNTGSGNTGSGNNGSSQMNIEEIDDVWELELNPNTVYISTGVNHGLNISSIVPPINGALTAQYIVHCNIASGGYDGIVVPDTVMWANGILPDISAGGEYELSIVATKMGNNYIYKAILTRFQYAV
jgi:hypothetical protein